MKLDVPRDFSKIQARWALTLLEYVINGLLVFYDEMRSVYDIIDELENDDRPPF